MREISFLQDAVYKDIRITIIQANNPIRAENYIVFVHCTWSMAVNTLRKLLDSLVDYADVEVFILDTDDDNFYDFIVRNQLPQHGLFGGYGEILWFKSNKLVHAMGKSLEPQLLDSYHISLFKRR